MAAMAQTISWEAAGRPRTPHNSTCACVMTDRVINWAAAAVVAVAVAAAVAIAQHNLSTSVTFLTMIYVLYRYLR
jgi:hypothetical protein